MPVDYEAIGRTLRDARLKRGLKQSDVATHLEMTPQNVSLIEKGRVRTNLDNLEKYAEHVGCRVTVLLAREGDERGDLAGRIVDLLPRLDPAVVETLVAWADLWERKYGRRPA